MLVYGDHVTTGRSRDVFQDVRERLSSIAGRASGIVRHAALVSAFVRLGELLQGIADLEFEARRADDRSSTQIRVARDLSRLAGAIQRSWLHQFDAQLPVHPIDGPLPEQIRINNPEGYNLYAVYPEAYFEAARIWGARRLKIIGIRSIGTSLAAMVGAATNASTFATLRPHGPPFAREVAIAPDLGQWLIADAGSSCALVDEGPGLSGSSFGAVADWLEEHGIDRPRIHFFPSHGNDLGPESSERHRARWAECRRHYVDFDRLALRSNEPWHRLESWISDLVGPLDGPLEDISAGAWRHRCFGAKADWPPAHLQQERRKFLARSGSDIWLCKFVGLGRPAEIAVERASELSRNGFAPEFAGYRHGFLVERWIDPAGRLELSGARREKSVRRAGQYLAFRAMAFPVASQSGATPEELARMAVHNTSTALGEHAARTVANLTQRLQRAACRIQRVATDNRLHAWEWITRPDRTVLKTDAVDHCAGHDLIGCQDIAWDIAGAAIEFDLSAEQCQTFCRIIEGETRRAVDPRLVAALVPCYLAFQLGYYRLAARALAGAPEEAHRLGQRASFYCEKLRALPDLPFLSSLWS